MSGVSVRKFNIFKMSQISIVLFSFKPTTLSIEFLDVWIREFPTWQIKFLGALNIITFSF
jgi:hypothetical protein